MMAGSEKNMIESFCRSVHLQFFLCVYKGNIDSAESAEFLLDQGEAKKNKFEVCKLWSF